MHALLHLHISTTRHKQTAGDAADGRTAAPYRPSCAFVRFPMLAPGHKQTAGKADNDVAACSPQKPAPCSSLKKTTASMYVLPPCVRCMNVAVIVAVGTCCRRRNPEGPLQSVRARELVSWRLHPALHTLR